MNKLKTGISLIILGNILYLSYIFFTSNETSSFGEFTKGLTNYHRTLIICVIIEEILS